LPGVHHDSSCILLIEKNQAIIVDPGTSWYQILVEERIVAALDGAHPIAIILTHRHYDAAGAAAYLSDVWGVPILAHQSALSSLERGDWLTTLARNFDSEMPLTCAEELLLDEPLNIGSIDGIMAIPLPGHTGCSIGLWIERLRTIIAGGLIPHPEYPARWDAPTGCLPDLVLSLEKVLSLQPKILMCGIGPMLKGEGKIAKVLLKHIASFQLIIERKGELPQEWARPAKTTGYLTPKPAWGDE